MGHVHGGNTDWDFLFYLRLLRIALNIRYPKIISNAKLCNITKEIPISEKIKRRRLALLGHILRLDVDTPAQKALQFYLTPHKRPVGRPVTTWVQIITKDLKNTTKHHNIKTPLTQTSLQKLIEIAKDNVRWKQEIVRYMKRDLWNTFSVSKCSGDGDVFVGKETSPFVWDYHPDSR